MHSPTVRGDHNIELTQKLFVLVTYGDACFLISRLLQHFPCRQVERDAVVTADLAGDFVSEKISLCVVIDVCDEVRAGATRENPYFPPTGEMRKLAINKLALWKSLLNKIGNSKKRRNEPSSSYKEVDTVPWYGKCWQDFTEEDKKALDVYLRGLLLEERKEYLKYMQSLCGLPVSVARGYC